VRWYHLIKRCRETDLFGAVSRRRRRRRRRRSRPKLSGWERRNARDKEDNTHVGNKANVKRNGTICRKPVGQSLSRRTIVLRARGYDTYVLRTWLWPDECAAAVAAAERQCITGILFSGRTNTVDGGGGGGKRWRQWPSTASNDNNTTAIEWKKRARTTTRYKDKTTLHIYNTNFLQLKYYIVNRILFYTVVVVVMHVRGVVVLSRTASGGDILPPPIRTPSYNN